MKKEKSHSHNVQITIKLIVQVNFLTLLNKISFQQVCFSVKSQIIFIYIALLTV